MMEGKLRELLDSEIPASIANVEDASSELERVAAFSEANFNQAPNKEAAFNETKRLALQSLAGLAYYINHISSSMLQALELEADHLALKTNEMHNLSQLIAIQKEKTARREIGKLTINKAVARQNKITTPAVEERTPRYQRTAIDYSILDGIGHGVRAPPEYGSPAGAGVMLNRTNSMASGASSISSATQLQMQQQYHDGGGGGMTLPLYDQYGSMMVNPRQGFQQYTLTRGGRNTQPMQMDQQPQYRVPRAIPSAIVPQEGIDGGGIYSDGRYSSAAGGAYGTISGVPAGYAQMRYLQSEDSSDGLPLPPPGASHHPPPPPPMYMHPHPHPHPEDPLPPPPQMMGDRMTLVMDGNYSTAAAEIAWTPQEYIERARVIFSYEASRPDELTLTEGTEVFVINKNADGWYEGVVRSHDGSYATTGLFPGNYVAPMGD